MSIILFPSYIIHMYIYIYIIYIYILVGLEHDWILTFLIYWECHHPNSRTHIFQRGRYTTNQLWFLWRIHRTSMEHGKLFSGENDGKIGMDGKTGCITRCKTGLAPPGTRNWCTTGATIILIASNHAAGFIVKSADFWSVFHVCPSKSSGNWVKCALEPYCTCMGIHLEWATPRHFFPQLQLTIVAWELLFQQEMFDLWGVKCSTLYCIYHPFSNVFFMNDTSFSLQCSWLSVGSRGSCGIIKYVKLLSHKFTPARSFVITLNAHN